VFAAPGIVKALPVSKNDIKRAENVEKYENWQVMYEMEEYEDVMDRLLLMKSIYGVGVKKLYYDPIKQRPVTEYISVLDFIVPYRTKSLETARRKTHRLWLHYDELLKRKEKKIYDAEQFKNVKETASEPEYDELKVVSDEATGQESSDSADNPFTVYERHMEYDLGDLGYGDGLRPYIITVEKDSQTVLRITSSRLKTADVDEVMEYFIDYHFIPNPEGWYSFGFGHFLEHLNEMANTVFNQMIDSGRLTNQPWGFYTRRAGFKKKRIELSPGSMNEIADVTQVLFPGMQRVDQILPMSLGLINQYVEKFTSVTDYSTGRETKGVERPTASGTLAILEQGSIAFTTINKRAFRSLRKELRLLTKINHIYLSDTKEYRVMGGKEGIAFPDIKREDFKGVYDVIPLGDPTFASRLSKRREAMERYQIMMSNPLVVGNPQLQIPPQLRSMHAALSGVLDTYGTLNKSELLPELPEEPISPEEENALFIQGDSKSPLSGENHNLHIMIHINFTNTEFFKTMPEAYKKLLVDHLKETRAMQARDATRLANLGGLQGQPSVTPEQEAQGGPERTEPVNLGVPPGAIPSLGG
jgi:hypothetical protein